MLNKEYPLGRPVYKISDNLDDYYGICYAKIETNQIDRGILPYKMGNILLTPLGTFEGWYYSEELKLAKKMGYKIKIVAGYHCKDKGSVFKNFVTTFNEMKVNAENPTIRYIAKIILNSAYGYLGVDLDENNVNLQYDDVTEYKIDKYSDEKHILGKHDTPIDRYNTNIRVSENPLDMDHAKPDSGMNANRTISIKDSSANKTNKKYTNTTSITLALMVSA